MKKVSVFLTLIFTFGYCEYHDPADEELGTLTFRLRDGLEKAAAFKDTTPALTFPLLTTLDDTVKKALVLLRTDTLSGLKESIVSLAGRLAQLRRERTLRKSWSEKTLNSLAHCRRRLAARLRLRSEKFQETLTLKGIPETVDYAGFAFNFTDLSFELKKTDPVSIPVTPPASGAIFYNMLNNFDNNTKNYFNHSTAFTPDQAPPENSYTTLNQEDYYAGASGAYFRRCAALFALRWTDRELINPLLKNDITYKTAPGKEPILSIDRNALLLFKSVADSLPYRVQTQSPASLNADFEYGADRGVVYVKKMTATPLSAENPSFTWTIDDHVVFDR